MIDYWKICHLIRSFLSYVLWIKKCISTLNKMPLMVQPVLFQMWTVPQMHAITLRFLALHLKEWHWHRHIVIPSPNKLFWNRLKDKTLTSISEERHNYYNWSLVTIINPMCKKCLSYATEHLTDQHTLFIDRSSL